MKLLLIAAMVAAAAATSPAPPEPDCQCDLALAHQNPALVIYQLPGEWAGGCEHQEHPVCLQECGARRDQLEADGAWEAETEDGSTVGQLACEAIGRDEPIGIHSVLLGALCGERLTEEGVGLKEPLCCQDGAAVPCVVP